MRSSYPWPSGPTTWRKPEVIPMRMYDIIHKKRNGGELSHQEISWLVKAVTEGSVPDYQV